MPKKKKLDALGNEIKPGRKIARGVKASGRLVLSMLPMEEARIRAAAAAAGEELSPWARRILLAQAPEMLIENR